MKKIVFIGFIVLLITPLLAQEGSERGKIAVSLNVVGSSPEREHAHDYLLKRFYSLDDVIVVKNRLESWYALEIVVGARTNPSGEKTGEMGICWAVLDNSYKFKVEAKMYIVKVYPESFIGTTPEMKEENKKTMEEAIDEIDRMLRVLTTYITTGLVLVHIEGLEENLETIFVRFDTGLIEDGRKMLAELEQMKLLQEYYKKK